jgi:hypothetical protein
MGLDLLDFVWDFLKQSFLFVVAAVVLFLVVASATNDDLFMQYYAKETGLVMETLHAARGDVELSYNKLLPKPVFNYRFEGNGVLLQPAATTKPEYWPVRKRYGNDSVLSVAGSTLLAPATIVFEKQGTSIRAATASSPPMSCQALIDKPLRISTKLTVAGNSPLVTPQLKQLEQQYAPTAAPTTFISITVEKDPSLKAVVVETSGDALGQALGCLLSQRLAASLPTASIELRRAPASADFHVTIHITHSDVAGLDDAKLNQALQVALGEVLR